MLAGVRMNSINSFKIKEVFFQRFSWAYMVLFLCGMRTVLESCDSHVEFLLSKNVRCRVKKVWRMIRRKDDRTNILLCGLVSAKCPNMLFLYMVLVHFDGATNSTCANRCYYYRSHASYFTKITRVRCIVVYPMYSGVKMGNVHAHHFFFLFSFFFLF